MTDAPEVAPTKSMSAMRSVAVAVVISIVSGLLLVIQQGRVITLESDVVVQRKGRQEAVAANLESQKTITTLTAEMKRNAAYNADLSKRLKVSDDKAIKARKDFEKLKHDSKPVRDWAAQPLPDGLRGKTASPAKGSGRTN